MNVGSFFLVLSLLLLQHTYSKTHIIPKKIMTFALPPRLPLHISTTHTSSTLWQKLAFHLFTLIMFPSSSHHITSHLISFILQTVLLPPLLCLLLLLFFWYNSRDDVIIFRYSFSSFCMGFFHLYLIGAHVDSATMFNVHRCCCCSLFVANFTLFSGALV